MTDPDDLRWGVTLSADDGVLVRRALLAGRPVVIKTFLDRKQAREIHNYSLLEAAGIDTLQVIAAGDDWLALEDIEDSPWRLATPDDLTHHETVGQLAGWYAQLHRAGAPVAELASHCEHDLVTAEALAEIAARWPVLAPGLAVAEQRLASLVARAKRMPQTLTYNDFSWDNMLVARDGSRVAMFDFNLLGRGYRFGDLRNVCTGLGPMGDPFMSAYLAAGGTVDSAEVEIDQQLAPLFCLVEAARRGMHALPRWAQPSADWVVSLTSEG